jgi:hypothetical protein
MKLNPSLLRRAWCVLTGGHQRHRMFIELCRRCGYRKFGR